MKVDSQNSPSVFPFKFLKLIRSQWNKKISLFLRSKDPTTQDRPTIAMCCHAHTTSWYLTLKMCLDSGWVTKASIILGIISRIPMIPMAMMLNHIEPAIEPPKQTPKIMDPISWPRGLHKAAKVHYHGGQQDQRDRPLDDLWIQMDPDGSRIIMDHPDPNWLPVDMRCSMMFVAKV